MSKPHERASALMDMAHSVFLHGENPRRHLKNLTTDEVYHLMEIYEECMELARQEFEERP